MVFFFLWLLLSAGVAAAAKARGQSEIGWFLLSVLISPLLGLILLLALTSQTPHGRMRVDVYDGDTRRYRRVRLGDTVNTEDVEWVGQEILRQGVCTYRGFTIYDAGRRIDAPRITADAKG